MSPEVLEDILESLSVSGQDQAPPAPPPLSFLEIGYGYRSGRSFGYSVLLHEIALLLIVFSSRYVVVRHVEAVPPRLEAAVPLDKTIYLPVLGGGSEGAGAQGGGAGSADELSSGVRARSRRGFAYPGPQPMVSAPPRAVLGIQTILQPALNNPPLLRQFIPLPNITEPAEKAVAEPPKPVLKVLAGEVALRRTDDPPVQAPKITLPVAAASQAPQMDASQPIMPQLIPAKPVVPGPAEISNVPVNQREQKGLLVINAVPAPPDLPRNIPASEARSLFAVTPLQATIIAEPGAGSKSGITAPTPAGVGAPSDVASGDALAEAAAGGSRKNATGSGTGISGKYGRAQGTGLNPTAEASGTGRGMIAGVGTGSGTGTTVGSGKGAGSAAGTGGFPGITISGGRYGNTGVAGGNATLTPHKPTPYGMTITSTASSGGGLPDFGVFQNEKVYTVYLDMRSNDEDSAPSWTLQYAVLHTSLDSAERIRGTPTPPYAILKEVPVLPPELSAKCAHRLIVASAILNEAGRLGQVSVRQSPDPGLDAPVTEALNHWMFQPVQIEGKPVSLKMLFGIRLSR